MCLELAAGSLTGRPRAKLSKAVAMVTPADGPSSRGGYLEVKGAGEFRPVMPFQVHASSTSTHEKLTCTRERCIGFLQWGLWESIKFSAKARSSINHATLQFLVKIFTALTNRYPICSQHMFGLLAKLADEIRGCGMLEIREGLFRIIVVL